MRRTAADMRLRSATIRLAYENPELRPFLLPLLQRHAQDLHQEEMDMMAGRRWDGDTAKPDSYPYESHKKKNLGPAGKNNSADRREYNQEYRDKVCDKGSHPTDCGRVNDKRK
jgi:hypothetical protein